MSSQVAAQMTIGIPGVTITIWYDDVTLRLLSVEWNISLAGYEARIRIWNTDISPTTPLIDVVRRIAQGSVAFVGDHYMVEVTDPEIGTYLSLPEYILFTFWVYEI